MHRTRKVLKASFYSAFVIVAIVMISYLVVHAYANTLEPIDFYATMSLLIGIYVAAKLFCWTFLDKDND